MGVEEPIIGMEKLPVQDWNGVSKLKMGNVPNEQE
jgi:hypothetical protein